MTETTTLPGFDMSTSADSVSKPTGAGTPADALGEPKRMTESDGERQESTECPTCGREDFTSRQGMKVHHKRIHGESIAGVDRVCDYCGDDFTARRARVDRGEAKYCSLECRHDAREQQGTVDRTCKECGEEFTVLKTQLDHRPADYCSLECTGEKQSRERLGEDHPNWKGGYSQNRDTNWPALRERALEDNDYCCQGCGRHDDDHREEHGVGLHVHHIRPVTSFETPEDADTVDNLVPLCRDCHYEWEGIPIRPVAE